MKILRCKKCGNVIAKLNDHCDGIFCCGEKMEELVPNTVEAAVEKHKPVIKEIDGTNYIVVGDTEHPMEEKHFIEWIMVVKDNNCKIHFLKPGEKPQMVKNCSCKPDAVYAYCNLHGLWKMD